MVFFNFTANTSGTANCRSAESSANLPARLLASTSFPQGPDYFIYTDGASYFARSGSTGLIVQTNTDFATLFQNVLNGITPAGTATKIVIGAGNFYIHNLITFPSTSVGNIHIQGQGMGVTNLLMASGLNSQPANNNAIQIGTKPTASNPGASTTGTLTADGTVHSSTITVSLTDAAKFAVGQFILVSSTKLFSAYPSGGAYQGELHRILALDLTTGIVTLDVPLFDVYTVANASTIWRVDDIFMQNIKISDLTIAKDSSLTSQIIGFVHFYFVNNVALESVQMTDNVATYQNGITFTGCLNVACTNCFLLQNSANPYNFQYGIALQGCNQNVLIDHCRAYGRFRHPFELAGGIVSTNRGFAGVVRGILVSNNVVEGGFVAAFSTHADGEGINFANNTVAGTTTIGGSGYGNGFVAFEMRSKRPILTGNSVKSMVSDGYEVTEEGNYAQIINCTCSDSERYGVNIFSGTKNVSIVGGSYVNNEGQGIFADVGANYLSIVGTQCSTNWSDGIKITDSDHVKITGCQVVSNSGNGIYLNNPTVVASGITVINNDVSNNTLSGIFIHINVKGASVFKDNIGFNPIGTLTNAFSSGAGPITDLPNASGFAAPTSATLYTNAHSPKTITMIGGTVSQVQINGVTVSGSTGTYWFKLGIGETIQVTYSAAPTFTVYVE